MKMKSTIVALAVMAAVGASVTATRAATSVHLDIEYIGSTTNNASAANRVAQNVGTGVLLNTTTAPGGNLSTISSGLTQMNLADPGIQSTTNLKNYFAVYLNFSPDVSGDVIYGLAVDFTMPTGMVPVSGNNLVDTTTAKILTFNPTDSVAGVTTWDTIGDFGSAAGDLKAVNYYQSDATNAGYMLIGQPGAVGNGDEAGYIAGKGTLLGVFALRFTGSNVAGAVGASVLPTNCAWWSGMDPVYSDAAFSANSIPVGSTPEPASLGVLALGGLALLARRRK